MLLGQPPGGWLNMTAPAPGNATSGALSPQALSAMLGYAPAGFGGWQGLPGLGSGIPMGAARFLPGGPQPGLGLPGGYQPQPYGFAPATGMGPQPFFPGQSLQNRPKAPVIPADWSPEMKQRYQMLLSAFGDRVTPAMFAQKWAMPTHLWGGGEGGQGPRASAPRVSEKGGMPGGRQMGGGRQAY